jgi:hypothetical protein
MPILFNVIVVLVVCGLLYWILTLIPLPAPFPQIIRVVVIVAVVLYLLSVFLPFTGMGGGWGAHSFTGPCR